MPGMLQFTRLALRRGSRRILEDLDLQIHAGQKVGVTGANGSGKSSLFSLILGELGPDAGDFAMPGDWVVAHVAQETPSDTRAAREYVLDGDAELRRLERQMQAADARGEGTQLARLYSDFEHIGGFSAPARAGRLLHGLGFSADQETAPVDSFSGGFRMRLNLARALMCRSSLLLLDEPTNHLDLDAVIWLEEWLRAYPGTLLLVSHDREFLDAVAERILHLESGRATLYTGNYTAFERARSERLARQRSQFEKQQREIVHIRSFINRFRAKASKARQAQSRIKALERLELIAPAHVDSPFRFSLLAPERTPNPLLRLDAVSVGYDSSTVLSGVRLTLAPGDRIGLLGRNGAGKSTLIRLLAGRLSPRDGERLPANDLRVGYFAQHQLEQLDPERSALDHCFDLDPAAREADLRRWLGGFGFPGESVFAATGPFSGGEKSRLALALLVYRRPNLLLLDEPTNHLDLEMREALALALQEFAGAMVIVSHDRHLLRVTADRLMLVDAGEASDFSGDLDDYRHWLARAERGGRVTAGERRPERGRGARRDRRRRDADARQRLRDVNRRVRESETRLGELQRSRQDLERELADPDLYVTANAERLKACLERQAENRRELERAETAWFDAHEALEQLREPG